MNDEPIYRRAYHECGHAVGSRQLGLTVTALSLNCATSMIPLMDSGEMTDSGRRRFATIAYCGPVAEAQYCRLTSDECTTLWLDGAPWGADRQNIEHCQLGGRAAELEREGGHARQLGRALGLGKVMALFCTDPTNLPFRTMPLRTMVVANLRV